MQEGTAVSVINAEGRSPFVLVCDHASNFIPSEFGDLGLTRAERESHIAWDPGAMAVSKKLVELLDAPLVASKVSRIVIDCNRDIDAPDLIWTLSEATPVPGNLNLTAAERQSRIDRFHTPFHAAIDDLLNARASSGQRTVLVCMHSFTPIYLGIARPWEIGLIHGTGQRYSRALLAQLEQIAPDVLIGWNEPYAALNGVTLTLEKHGDGRGLDATMIEIRNDEIVDNAGVGVWAERLAAALVSALAAVDSASASLSAGGAQHAEGG